MNANRGKIDKVKTLKDVDAPKKPSSSYLLFCAKERGNVQQEMQGCNGAEVTKELGKRWAALDDKDKEVFEEAAKKDKERYEEERRSYTPSEEFIKRKAEFDAKANLPNNSVVGQSGSSHEEYFSYLLLNWRQVKILVLPITKCADYLSLPRLSVFFSTRMQSVFFTGPPLKMTKCQITC